MRELIEDSEHSDRKYYRCVECAKKVYCLVKNGRREGTNEYLCTKCRPKWSERVRGMLQNTFYA